MFDRLAEENFDWNLPTDHNLLISITLLFQFMHIISQRA